MNHIGGITTRQRVESTPTTETAPAVAGNDCDRGPRHDTSLEGIVTETQSTHIAWTCATCDEPIADGEGAVGIPFADLSLRNDATLVWRVEHYDCTGHLDIYGRPVAELRTVADVLSWTAHIITKPWIHESTWDDVLRGVLEEVAA